MQNPPIPPHRSSLTPWKVSLLAGVGLLSLSLGCRSDRVAHYRVPKEAVSAHSDHPDHPGHEAHAAPGPEAAPPQAEAPKGGLKWSLPQGWTQVPGEGMRFATLQAPVQGRLEATVVVLAGTAGGELANVNRWRGQIALPPLDEAGLAKARVTLKTKAGSLNAYDFTSDGQAKSRMVAGYIATPDGNTWFLKMTGDPDPVAKAKPDFMTILGSVRLD